jgi:PBP1b-binding outer membrane lipoprotein LpoB
MKFVSKAGKIYWKNPEKQKLWAAKTRAKKINITDIRKAVARECLFLGETSKNKINNITKMYIDQLKNDGFLIYTKSTRATNATMIQRFIEDGSFNHAN